MHKRRWSSTFRGFLDTNKRLEENEAESERLGNGSITTLESTIKLKPMKEGDFYGTPVKHCWNILRAAINDVDESR